MEIVGCDGNAELTQIAQERAVGGDVFIASRLAQLQARRAIRIMDARVDLHAEFGETLLHGAKLIERDGRLAEFEARPAQADLLKEEQVVVSDGAGIDAVGDLDVVGVAVLGEKLPAAEPRMAFSKSLREEAIIRLTPGLPHWRDSSAPSYKRIHTTSASNLRPP